MRIVHAIVLPLLTVSMTLAQATDATEEPAGATTETPSKQPTTERIDSAVDWLMQNAEPVKQPSEKTNESAASTTTGETSTAPATSPADPPTTAPSQDASAAHSAKFDKIKQGSVKQGSVKLSDGTTLTGELSTTPGRPLRVWVESEKRFVDVGLETVRSMSAKVVWERDEAEWRFKESGHDEKIFSGRTYPAREVVYDIELVNGQRLEGGVVAPVYVKDEKTVKQLVLHKRDKGEPGKKLKDLVYIVRIDRPE